MTDTAQTLRDYATLVARGEAWTPMQKRASVSDVERVFRLKMEKRKDDILARRAFVRNPVLLTQKNFDIARSNIATTAWAREWFDGLQEATDHILTQPDGYIESMIPELTPTAPYAFNCPACVGRLSAASQGSHGITWDYRKPDILQCKTCGQEFPDARFPETRKLVCPRRGQSFAFFRSPDEDANPDDLTGRFAWRWADRPAFGSAEGIIREYKTIFMMVAARKLALMHRLTGNERHAETAAKILARLARTFPLWLYHDYRGCFADCDPLYAAWHDAALPVEWKRHPATYAYFGGSIGKHGQHDEWPDKAGMLSTYFGSGIIHPSADAFLLQPIIFAYDLLKCATDASGRLFLDEQLQTRIERDLILEALFMSEPFLGGPGRAEQLGNKGPSVYQVMASAGRALGLPDFAHVALMGYEKIRDNAFLFDGFSTESPAYGEMFLRSVIWVPEILEGLAWPEGFDKRKGKVSLFRDDPKLAAMLSALLQTLRPDARYLPLSDTPIHTSPNTELFEICLNRKPELFAGALPFLYRSKLYAETSVSAPGTPFSPPLPARPDEYAALHLNADALAEDSGPALAETFFPAWRTAIMRHGRGTQATALTMTLNLPGKGHRHLDNLAVFYSDRGRDILGEQGYVCDTEMLAWGVASASHNLVLVDSQEQRLHDPPRRSSLRFMASTALASVAEADSDGYSQCSKYRRRVVLLKGPDNATVALDLFRVTGGNRHEYRLFSNLAASDAEDSAMVFEGLDLKAPCPVSYGASTKKEDVFGLRDTQAAANPPACWQAIWQQKSDAYRLHVLGKIDKVEASHGPGQQNYKEIGRRVRYLGLVNEGKNLDSMFVALHEPSGLDNAWPVKNVKRLETPAHAGPEALALEIDTHWGRYLVFNNFEQSALIGGIQFQGWFGLVFEAPGGKRSLMTVKVRTCKAGDFGFADAPVEWRGAIASYNADAIVTGIPQPENWPAPAQGLTAYVLVGSQGDFTAYPVKAAGKNLITVTGYPMQDFTEFDFPAVQWMQE